MKKSKLETAETRRRIVKAAAAEFRKNGIHATGLCELMAAAGLTHGGFYRHFDSKDQLIAEACAVGMEAEVGGAAVCPDFGSGGLREIAASYLSKEHRDNPSEGCLLAGLGSELARSDDKTRAAASAGVLKLAETIAGEYSRTKPESAKGQALVALSAMLGAITLSRIVTDPEISAAILEYTKKYLTASVAPPRRARKSRARPRRSAPASGDTALAKHD
jgi:TetR/AcrR family transcriptional regulator, transcriptional repressor for nem operon